jgi:hypothetical protein
MGLSATPHKAATAGRLDKVVSLIKAAIDQSGETQIFYAVTKIWSDLKGEIKILGGFNHLSRLPRTD